MSDIFVCYRRDDSRSASGRLAEALQAHFGAARVFRDQDSIAAGADFVETIRRTVSASTVVLAVVGPRWLALGSDGRRRLDDPADYVRLEIESALAAGVAVVPVLVEGAAMPDAAALPASLGAFARCQAVELSDSRWRHDLDALAATLQSRFAIPAEAPAGAGALRQGWAQRASRLLLDLIELMARPRQLIARRQTGAASDAPLAVLMLLLCVAIGNVLLASALGRPVATLLFDGLIFGLLMVALLAAPLSLAWRLVGCRVGFRRVVAVAGYVYGGAWLWFCTGALLLVVGAQLVDDTVFDRARQLIKDGSIDEASSAMESVVRGPAAALFVVASVVWTAGLVWLVAAWGAFRRVYVASRLAAAGATALWLAMLGAVGAAAWWAGTAM